MVVNVVEVHAGAGYHSPSSEKEVKAALKRACQSALTLLNKGGSSVQAVERAICELEDDEFVNAGYGSNLAMDGAVECDASLMEGIGGHYGAVGAVSGVKNPICIARALLEQSRSPGVIGKVHPLALVSTGAYAFATQSDVPVVPAASQVSPRALKTWKKWKDKFDRASSDKEIEDDSHLEDTCGALALDSEGAISSGVSSGGVLLKSPGRIGQAAVFGAGCWAVVPTASASGAACSVSGTGEYIVRASLARTLAEALAENQEQDPMEGIRKILADFHRMCWDRGNHTPSVGALILTQDIDSKPRLWCGFTTRSMALAYASTNTFKVKTVILRQPLHENTQEPRIYISSLPV